MRDDDFMAMCKSIDPSKEVDRKKNLETIKNRLKKEEEHVYMIKNKKFRKPAVAAAVLAGLLSISAVAYAAVNMVWRPFDTQVVQGEEFVNEFIIAEIDMPDGTVSVGSSIDIDFEALRATDGGAIIVEVDGEEWVYLDELHLDNLADGLALLQLDNVSLPGYLPEGFSFSQMTFPVNPNNHEYMMGILPAAKHTFVYFTNGDDIIRMQIGYSHGMTLGASYWLGQQSVSINGNDAVLISGNLSEEEFGRLEATTARDWEHQAGDIFSGHIEDGLSSVNMLIGDIMYTIHSESGNVTLYDLVRMAESME